MTSFTEPLTGGSHPPVRIRPWSRTMRLPPGWSGSTNPHSGSPQGRTATGTLVAVHAPESGDTSPGLPSTIGRKRASPRTSYNVWWRHERMEHQLAASTSDIASMLAAHVLLPVRVSIFHYFFELLKYRLYCSNFILTFFIVIILVPPMFSAWSTRD